MTIFIATLAFFWGAMVLMAVGVLLGGAPLAGGCGRAGGCRCKDRS